MRICAIAALLTVSTVAQGTDDVGAELARRLLIEGKILPLEEVVGRARVLREGSLIEADLHYEAGHAGYVYELHMLDNAGAVWELEFHADSGKLIEHEIVDH
ncbi:MAG: hypothetical protein WBG92_24325 [Thiohalocapsa sp.]